jgi:polysaccharide biosynthesis transport protein
MSEHDLAERPDLRVAKSLLRRRWPMMLPFLLIPLAALLFSLHQEKRYTASSSVAFSQTETIASTDPAREAATNIQLLSGDAIRRSVQRRLPNGQIADEVEVEQDGDANVLKITATDPDPQRAAATANAYAAQYLSFRRDTARRKILEEQQFVRSEIARLPSSAGQANSAGHARLVTLNRRLRQLQFDASQETGGAQIVSLATPPTTASSPKPVRNTVIGAAVGLFLAVLAALLFDRLDPRLTTPRDVAATVGRPILGMVRKSRALARASAMGRPPPADADEFLALRARVRYANESRGAVRSVLVTSSAEGDGKTTIAWNLARAAAGPDTRVLFVEADLRNPTLTKVLGADPERSVTQVLNGRAALSDVIQEIAFPDGQNGGRPAPVVSVALAGRAPTRTTDPLAWERLGTALHAAEREFDLIVIDTAPIVSVPDAIPLLGQVGGVVVVGRLRRTPRAALARLRDELEAVGAPTLGVVVNSVRKDAIGGYGYGYGRR